MVPPPLVAAVLAIMPREAPASRSFTALIVVASSAVGETMPTVRPPARPRRRAAPW